MLIATSVNAQVEIAVDDVEAVPGETLSFALRLKCEPDRWKGMEFNIELPEGMAYTSNSTTNTTRWPGGAFTMGSLKILGASLSNNKITGNDFDEIGTFEFTVNSGMELGNYQAKITNFLIVDADDQTETIDELIFNIHVVAHHLVILDELSTTLPSNANDVNVTVKRTIKANQWNTIVLPFEMTGEQVKTAFGEDVMLADFDSYVTEKDASDNITKIIVKFNTVASDNGMEINHPYLIKTSSNVSEFTLGPVDIAPDEENAAVEYDNGLTGRRRHVYGGLYGTFHTETVIEEFGLFLSDNQFWYSTGLTKMKAFRAYFFFEDILSDVENAGAKIRFNVDDTVTNVNGINNDDIIDGNVYSVQGLLMGKNVKWESLPKGIYIVNGRKVFKN